MCMSVCVLCIYVFVYVCGCVYVYNIRSNYHVTHITGQCVSRSMLTTSNSWLLVLFVVWMWEILTLWECSCMFRCICLQRSTSSVVSQTLSSMVLVEGLLLVWSLLVGLGWWANKPQRLQKTSLTPSF